MAWDGFFAVFICLFALLLPFSFHTVPEGYVGIYTRGGRLTEDLTDPGAHLKLPFLTSYTPVQVTVQTDCVKNIPCGTSGGVMLSFESIEVTNRLKREHVLKVVRTYGVDYDKIWIFDRIHHLINQFCSSHSLHDVYIAKFSTLDEALTEDLQKECDKWDTGIEIISARVTKPRIPDSVALNYESVELEKAKLRIATERQKVLEKEAETDQFKAEVEARTKADVSIIHSQIELLEKQTNQKIQLIDDQINFNRLKKTAEARYYKSEKEAESNKLKLSKEHVAAEFYTDIEKASKTYFVSSFSKLLEQDAFLAEKLVATTSNSDKK